MTSSTFYHDGFGDAKAGICSPPDVPVYAAEYKDGHADAQAQAYEDATEPCDVRCVW